MIVIINFYLTPAFDAIQNLVKGYQHERKITGHLIIRHDFSCADAGTQSVFY